VLDQSGSMDDFFGSGMTRQEAMKAAVKNFISSVRNDASANGANHRIAIVTFSEDAQIYRNFSADYPEFESAVSNLPNPRGSTNTAKGMLKAKTLIDGISGQKGRNRAVIVFTDGVPSSGSDFDASIATDAISISKAIKDAGATVYTIGIFGGANPNQLYGDQGFAHNSDGTVGSYWDARRILFWGDVTKAAVPAGNRFLNYLSSNYGGATEIGLSRYGYDIGFWAYEKYTITMNFTRTAAGNYYLTAKNSEELNSIFESISSQIGSPDTLLGDGAAIRDVISDYFNMPDSVSAYTVACTGKSGDTYTWADTEIPFSSAELTIDTAAKTVSASGFPYDQQYVTAVPRNGTDYGSKFVVTFTVSPREGFWGGNKVPTNTSASGLYSGSSLVEDFNIPEVDVPINVPFTAKDVSIYLSGTVKVQDLYYPISEQEGADSWKDDFIDVIGISYAASFDSQPSQAQTSVPVTATIPPLHSGTYGSKQVSAAASITVYKPEITFADSTIYYGEKADYAKNLTEVSWKHGLASADPASMLGAAPELTYVYSPEAAWFDADTAVDVGVRAGNRDITGNVTFINGGNTHSGSAQAGEFAVKVKTCSLTISKSGCDGTYGDDQTFIINIKGANLS
ncbi:MAG: VWA domain-containing protein, partial [Clostridiales bacterium]|nr:VWA domain-containing protein [Clostridiales bacterium]